MPPMAWMRANSRASSASSLGSVQPSATRSHRSAGAALGSGGGGQSRSTPTMSHSSGVSFDRYPFNCGSLTRNKPDRRFTWKYARRPERRPRILPSLPHLASTTTQIVGASEVFTARCVEWQTRQPPLSGTEEPITEKALIPEVEPAALHRGRGPAFLAPRLLGA
jgi:hypothetical protein